MGWAIFLNSDLALLLKQPKNFIKININKIKYNLQVYFANIATEKEARLQC